MAEYLHFSRDSKLYLAKDGYLWSVPVLDGFSFSQATNASEITLNEMEDSSGRSRRGRKMFTDSLSAAEWSFSTYIRPFKSTGGSKTSASQLADSTAGHHHAVEEALWVAMAGQNVYMPDTGKFQHNAAGGAISTFTINTVDTNGVYTADTTTAISVPGENADVTGGGVNAVVSVTTDAFGKVTNVEATEKGTHFTNASVITIAAELLGGDAGVDTDLELSVTSRTLSSDADSMDINFNDSNRSALGTFDLYFVFSDASDGRLLYRLKDAAVNEASIDFDIDGIAMVSWSGMAGQIVEVIQGLEKDQVTASPTAPTAAAKGALWINESDNDNLNISTAAGSVSWYNNINEGSEDTGNFIRNRLTSLTLAPTPEFWENTTFDRDGDGTGGDQYQEAYQIAITGGNVTITNNISYLTPEEIGKVNQPIEHVTGSRTVGGSLTCYLASSDAATDRSKNLFQDLVADINTVINQFAITLEVGGTDVTKPRFQITLPSCHLEVPSHSIEDVISIETNFSALGSTIGEADEVTLKYIGV